MINKLDDLIYLKHNALSKDFCDHCIEKFKKDPKKFQGMTGDGIRLDIKRSVDLQISDKEEWKEEDAVFYKSLNEAFSEYIDLHFDYLPNIRRDGYEDSGYQIQETEPGGFYTWHTDYMVNSKGWSRFLTFLWYLNDVHDEGETEFVMGNKIKPETGKLILFPASWMYYHRGCPPKKEMKYICTGWLYYDAQCPLD